MTGEPNHSAKPESRFINTGRPPKRCSIRPHERGGFFPLGHSGSDVFEKANFKQAAWRARVLCCERRTHCAREYFWLATAARSHLLTRSIILQRYPKTNKPCNIGENQLENICWDSGESRGTHYVIRMQHCSTRWERRWEPCKLCRSLHVRNHA